MKKFWRFTFTLIVFFLAACTTNTDSTPTPFSEVSTVASGTNNPLFAVEISELVANPEGYEGSLLAVNGRYHPIIPRVCSSSQYNSPSTWGLTAGEWMANMSGYDAQLKSLLPEETTMSVTGIWRQWRGPVGCGKDAVVQDIWYLDVQRIDSPNPLTHITLTPTIPGEVEIAEGGDSPGAEEESTPAPGPITEEVTPTNSSTIPESPNATPLTSNATATTADTSAQSTPANRSTPTQTSTATGSSSGNESAQETAVATNTTAPTSTSNPSTTATPTSNSSGTGNPSTPRPTANPLGTATPIGTATPTATATPTLPPTIVEKDEILLNVIGEVGFELLDANEIHEWEFEAIADTVSIHIANSPNIDTVISILENDNNVIIDKQNASSPDEIEVIALNNLTVGEMYKFQIETVGNDSGYYAVVILANDFFPDALYTIKDILKDADSIETTVELDTEDIWFFYAQAGDVVTISAAPSSATVRMTLALYTNDDIPLFADSPSDAAPAAIIDEDILQDGIYMLSVYEYDNWNEAEYTISLTIE